jgi:hypothetical protein
MAESAILQSKETGMPAASLPYEAYLHSTAAGNSGLPAAASSHVSLIAMRPSCLPSGELDRATGGARLVRCSRARVRHLRSLDSHAGFCRPEPSCMSPPR